MSHHTIGHLTQAMRVCIHRGTEQIGGTCIELDCDGQRILLDLGLPLDTGDREPASLLPPVEGLVSGDPSLLAIVLSHGHADHWGLIPSAAALPIVAGAATRRIMQAASAFVPRAIPGTLGDGPNLVDRQPVNIGPFRVTPYLVDHSAYDAYALLIEAGGRRLFYSGDLRAHGRKAALFERLIAHPPRPVHALLLEGSSLGRLAPGQQFPTEADIEGRLVHQLGPDGFVGVCASAQNIDRVVSLYRACKRTGRTLVLDLYAMEVLRATRNPNIPAAGWPNLAVYVPEYQRRHIARTKRFDLLDLYKQQRIYPEMLGPRLKRVAMLLRPAMLPDLDGMPDAWDKARVIWSQWDGYLDQPDLVTFRAKLTERLVAFEVVHTSGHASVTDLERFATALSPDVLVPIHTSKANQFSLLFGSHVKRRHDGEWWEV